MDLLKYKLYIFDYDGCLLDSMPMWRDSASSYMKYLGYTPAEDLDSRIPIFTDLYCGELLKKEYNLSMSIPEIMEDIDRFVDYSYPRCPLKDGALDIIRSLRDKNKIILVVSASGDHILELSMKAQGIYGSFDGVYSVYNHETLSKADGSAMEYVRRIFNVKKEEMLMLDDSLSNLLGAKQYGIDAVAIYDDYSSRNTKKELEENTLGLMTLREFAEMVR